ncbi:TIGR04222 domain-containing membrane protein [Nocardiopsis sp. HNM0947]|uniref:TIGR04222 domain-containing membrane protein n=1 Tax=Nocardiopsis coralli TaxID=2772213 RepID=A0ABR9PEZ7_9ACTN|nr:TIGR04222 domain-containing membrane protein [Nocardiopsis coralli]MBE3002300.1 TIGR04222 domain-containing membrane protein [Nocardiopsis coralli]
MPPELAQVLLIGAYPLFVACVLPLRLLRARLHLRHVAKRTGPDPRHHPQSPEVLDPAALAHLAGGPERVGQVAVVSALLDGRITPYGAPPGHVRRVGPDHHPSDDAVRAPLLSAFRTPGGGGDGWGRGMLRPVLVRDLVDTVEKSPVIDRIAAGLTSWGYTATGPDTERDRKILDVRNGHAMVWALLSMVLVWIGVADIWGDPHIDDGIVFTGIFGEAVAIGSLLFAPDKEQARRHTETPAARQLLRQARATYRDIGGKKVDRPWGRDEVLRHAAVTGFRGMRDMHRPEVVSRAAGYGAGLVGGSRGSGTARGTVGSRGPRYPGGGWRGEAREQGHGQEQVVALRVGPHTPDLLWGVAGAGLARNLEREGSGKKDGYTFEVEIDAFQLGEAIGGGFGDVGDGDGDGSGGGDGGGDGGGGGGE